MPEPVNGNGNGNGHKKNGNGRVPTLYPSEILRGKKLVIIGGTGFLGKVFWALLLSRYPMVSRLYLLVRPKRGETAEQRFWSEIATSEVMRLLHEQHGGIEFGGGIGKGEGPADKRPNLESIVKKTLKWREHQAQYLPAINAASIRATAQQLLSG